jgi:poly(3-hydroxybutyrate) depolymerase
MKTKLHLLAATMFLAPLGAGFCQSTLQFVINSSVVPDWATSTAVPDYASPTRLAVQRTNDINTEVSVDYATVDGSATAGFKYAATNGTLVFAPGESNKTIVVQLLDSNEGLVEGTKTFLVILSNPTNAVLGTPTTNTVSILDIDVGIQFQFAFYNTTYGWPLAEDLETVLIGVVRGDDANLAVTVDIATSDGTGTNGVDYIGFTNTLTFLPNERLKFVPITILNDGLKETANKTFKATLTNPVGVTLGTSKATTVTITDNDQGFQFQSATCYVAEDAGVALISVLRGTDDTNSTVTVGLATANGTALSGQDYVGLTNTLTFAPGEKVKVVPVPILNDGVKENTEYFRLTLSNPTGGAVLGSPPTTSVYIRDNDPGVSFEFTGYTNAWGQGAEFAVTVLRGNDGALGLITVDYATSNLTATAGEDYQAVSGTLTFQENQTLTNLSVPLLRGRAAAGTKSFRVTLSNPTSGVTLGTAITTVHIVGAYATVAPPSDTALTIRRERGVNILSWAGGGQLQRADKPTGPWETLLTATNPYTVQSPVPTTFYRVTRPRPVNLYVPSGYDGQTNLPLVILLHGYSPYAVYSTGAYLESIFQFQPLAEAQGFLYCYPEGVFDRKGRQYWNGTDINDFWSEHVDDGGYLRALIEEIGQQFALDRKRVYFFGHSTGGEMVYTMACRSADLIAGIAAMAGNTYLDPNCCQPSERVNVLSICGTLDEYSIYYGNAWGPDPPFNHSPAYPGAVRTAQIWAGYNGASDPVTDPAPTLDLALKASESGPDLPGLDTVVTRYTSSPPGGTVELWSIIGCTHMPGFSPEFSPRVIDWLLAHPKP